jgi:hypothetical protein
MAKTRRTKAQKEAFHVDYIEKCLKRYDDAITDKHEVWAELWQLYQNHQDNSGKASWQSTAFIPKIFTQIEKSSGEVKRALMQIDKLFKFSLNDQEEQRRKIELLIESKKAENAEDIGAIRGEIQKTNDLLEMRRQLMSMDEKRFKQAITQTNFSQVYAEMIKGAFLLGLGVPKVVWSPTHRRAVYDNVDANNISVSPDYKPSQMDPPSFIIERDMVELAELRRRAKAVNDAQGKAIYNMSAIRQIEKDSTHDEERADENRRRGLGDNTPFNSQVELHYFWGHVVDDEDYSDRNTLLVMANRRHIIRAHPNRYRHGKPPYVLTTPIIYPHRGIHGVSLVESMATLIYSYNNLFNMALDNMNFSVNKMFEYNPNRIINPETCKVMYPGKMIPTNSDQQVMREIITTNVMGDVRPMAEFISKEMQEATGVTEFLTGVGGKAKTLGETRLKTMESKGMFDIIARDLEQTSIRPLLEMTYDLYEQFAGYTPREDTYGINVGGISVQLQQDSIIQAAERVLVAASKSEAVAARTDLDYLIRRFYNTLNLGDAYKDPQEDQPPLSLDQENAVAGRAMDDAKRDAQAILAQGGVPMPEGM